MSLLTPVLVTIGLANASATFVAIVWSIINPSQRIWPPKDYTFRTPYMVWIPTFMLSGIIVALGILGWGDAALPDWLRFGIGLPLIIVSNIAVWFEVSQFGIAQTGGAHGSLRTGGLYRFSRNPQYVADSVMVLGWLLLSSAPLACLVGIPAIAVLVTAPFAEEPWLKERYGVAFDDYAKKVRRFI